jgi:hypothetical protein
MDERGNIQCELEIRNVSTVFSYQQQVPVTPVYNRNPAELNFISGFFMFGNYQFNIYIQPKLDSVGSIVGLKFYLVRSSSLDHMCRITYRFKFINGAYVHDSGVIEQYSDLNGASNSYRMDKAKELLQLTGKFVVRLELIKINSIFSNVLYPFNNKEVQPVNFLDRDAQKWSIESYIEDNSLNEELILSFNKTDDDDYMSETIDFALQQQQQQRERRFSWEFDLNDYQFTPESMCKNLFSRKTKFIWR